MPAILVCEGADVVGKKYPCTDRPLFDWIRHSRNIAFYWLISPPSSPLPAVNLIYTDDIVAGAADEVSQA